MILPSRELLIAVLGDLKGDVYIEHDTVLVYGLKNIGMCKCNIYELMHLMKEWACDKSFMLTTWYSDEDEDTGRKALCNIYEPYKPFSEITESFLAYTEQETVCKACEWILKQTMQD